MTNIVIFDRHFLRKLENDSNNYQLIFHGDSKTGLRIWIIRVFFLTSREIRLGSLMTFDPSFDLLKMTNEKKEEYFLLLLFILSVKDVILVAQL